ncbi:PIN domain-containing protein [Actinoplanes sp. HUAS TT8]|uniref:PIN domain-containing protein n=1 Tax=Actinoplanes sp. HUAS TT8 TaxID=3447453 RepID=UPI003F529052
MLLRQGQSVERAIQVLEDRVREAGNTRSAPRQYLLMKYLEWVRESERQFRSIFSDTEVLELLHSPRHWYLRANGQAEDLAVGPGVFHEELDAQQMMLREVIGALSGFRSLAGRQGEILVLDTNTIMHNRPVNEVDWHKEFEAKQIRLVIPLLVLDELDAKTYASSKQLAGRAEKRLRLLDQHLELAVSSASEVREGVSLEILPDPSGHRRLTDADHEILNRAEFVQQVCGGVVRVVSGDRGMRVRGISRKIPVQALSQRWRLSLEPEPSTRSPATEPTLTAVDDART